MVRATSLFCDGFEVSRAVLDFSLQAVGIQLEAEATST